MVNNLHTVEYWRNKSVKTSPFASFVDLSMGSVSDSMGQQPVAEDYGLTW